MRRIGVALVVVLLGAAVVVPAVAVADESTPASPWLARRPLNIAHAGGDLEAPHETMFAYEEAVAAGSDVLELDIRLSADGELMVIHDDTVDRTTNETGPVRDLTAAQLQALDNGYWFVPGCWSCHDRSAEEYQYRGVRTGARRPPRGHTARDFAIPTLREIFERFPARLLDIEIKDGPDGFAAADALAALIAEYDRADRVAVVSFDDAILAHFKALAPLIATSPGLGETTEWFFNRTARPHVALQVPPTYSGLEVVSAALVADAHRLGMAVWVWFDGNDDDVPDNWNRLLDMGVDGLITGKPRLLQQTIDARGGGFRTPLLPVGPLEPSRRGVRVPVGCAAVAADRCRAIVALFAPVGWHGRTVLVAVGFADVLPGAVVARSLLPTVWPDAWRRAATVTYVAWPLSADTAPALVPMPVGGGNALLH